MQAPRNLNDVMSGMLMTLMALFGFTLAWPLDSFSSFGIGPGYIPKMFALMLGGLGVAITAHGFLGHGEALDAWHPRPLLLVLGSIAFFGIAVQRLGLMVALVGMVIIASAAHRSAKPYQTIALAAFAAVFCFLVFIKGLGLTIPVWPTIQWGQ
jgi:putative tricarboxylic transport membrane protein